MSFYILIAFLFIGTACKSEVKPNPPSTEKNAVEKKTEIQNSPENKEEIKEQPVVKETVQKEEKADKPTKKTSPKANSSTEKSNNKNKPKVDRGIQIEMGMDDVETTIEEKKPVKEAVTEPVAEVNTPEVTKDPVKDKPAKPEIKDKPFGFPSHSILDGLLKANVSNTGVVDYAGLKSSEAKLDQYLKNLESNPPGTTWNREQELAYWINAYNAFTIKLILKNYPVKSITDLHGGKPWDVKWINLDGKNLSLNNIENDIIRPKYNEPRIHFAVNCAAKSCPPILNGAYKAKKLDAQLESQTKKFVNNPAYNTLGKNKIQVSKIFDWYGEDFGNVASFVLRYANTTVKPSAKVTFKEYDWALNGK